MFAIIIGIILLITSIVAPIAMYYVGISGGGIISMICILSAITIFVFCSDISTNQ